MQMGMTIPRATYRVQFHRGFTLRQAMDQVPYWCRLGVSHVYASPLLMARKGSTHGYDVCQTSCINPEIGSESDFEQFIEALRAGGMSLVLDIVPNHQGIGGRENPWWWDVLKHGRESRYAEYYDIDWELADSRRRAKVVLPVLGDELERVLERRELEVGLDEGEVVIRYFDRVFPVAPGSLEKAGAAAGEWGGVVPGPSALSGIIASQHYELVHWRQGDRLINYRRFFTITDLAGVRVELPQVFADTHRVVLEWHRRGLVEGYRIDHPDGLRDPEDYLQRLAAAAPGAWIVVEKILEHGEELPSEWPVAGTTGYDFLGRLTALLVDPAGAQALTEFYIDYTGRSEHYSRLVREKKRWMLRERLAAEVSRLTRLGWGIMVGAGAETSVTEAQFREAVVEAAASFPVYRTYFRIAETGGIESSRQTDVGLVEDAVATARRECPDLSGALDLLHDLMVGRLKGDAAAEWVMRFQQLTGPAMAKGVEDTAFYCYNRFVALNEVGCDPGVFGLEIDDFHRACSRARHAWPHGMLASATHDTKRGEDVRARLAVLSEMPMEWATAVQNWTGMNAIHRVGAWPERNLEYLYYQTLVGAWPVSVERAAAYMEKAAREAGEHTDWLECNKDYEDAVAQFVKRTLGDVRFIDSLSAFVNTVMWSGWVNGLVQTVLKLTCPGVPDVYQGTELWDLSLVDPDNRRPVDFEWRRQALEEMERQEKSDGASVVIEGLLQTPTDGRLKLYTIHRILDYRRREEELFREGQYVPLVAVGEMAARVGAFAREMGGGMMVVAVPLRVQRFWEWRGGTFRCSAVWGETKLLLPEDCGGRELRNVLTGERVEAQGREGRKSVRLSDIFQRFPVAVLELV